MVKLPTPLSHSSKASPLRGSLICIVNALDHDRTPRIRPSAEADGTIDKIPDEERQRRRETMAEMKERERYLT